MFVDQYSARAIVGLLFTGETLFLAMGPTADTNYAIDVTATETPSIPRLHAGRVREIPGLGGTRSNPAEIDDATRAEIWEEVGAFFDHPRWTPEILRPWED